MPVRPSHSLQPFPPLQNSFGLELLQWLWLRVLCWGVWQSKGSWLLGDTARWVLP